MHAGAADLRRAADALAARLPEPLAVLARLAYNYRWSWLSGGPELFEAIDPLRWERCHGNPVRLLQEVPQRTLERALADDGLLERAAALERAVHDDLERAPRAGGPSPERPVAFFCAEFAVHRSLPIYSGGLGALAGDVLKEASDLAVPMVGMGLMYHQGYFRQRVDASGWQHEYWVDTDPERLPAALVTGDDGRALTVQIPVGGVDAVAQVWRVDVGRVPLFLLDVERPDNDQLTRWISSRLYVSDPHTRLGQYTLLGAGGVRALAALGIEPGLLHLNEGHAALAFLESLRAERARGTAPQEAFAAARERTVFTTHTPVPAGNDTYPGEQVTATVGRLADEARLGRDELLRLGRSHPDDGNEPFGVTQFALRTSRAANGVSRRHGEVARDMWRALWPDRAAEDVPIDHVTNGVHLPTWVGGPMRRLLDEHLGDGWPERAADPATWAPVDAIPDEELWAARTEARAEMVEFVRRRATADRLARSEDHDYVQAAERAFDPDVLTIGFARRLATYKRLHLLLQDPGRSLALVSGERPIQLVIAGKAHPRDDEAKHLVQGLFGIKTAPGIREHVAFLDDYDHGVAGRLVRGCDVWVNVPRPPLEASGTSGMKSVANGGLHLSVLDGWWAEAFEDGNGWALPGDVDHDHGAQDHRDAAELYRLLEEEVVPAFYDRDDAGVPRAWVARVKASLRTLGPRFSATRMVEDYLDRMY